MTTNLSKFDSIIVGIFAAVVVYMVFSTLNPALGANLTSQEAIRDAQEVYFAQNGEYLQIKKNNELPGRYNGTVQGKIGGRLPDNYEVHIYEGPKGKGYVIKWEDTDNYYSQGYGAHADEYTKTISKQELASMYD